MTHMLHENKNQTGQKKMNLYIVKSITHGNEAEIYTPETFSELQARLLRDHGNEIVLAYPTT